jgi:hypothetical protein
MYSKGLDGMRRRKTAIGIFIASIAVALTVILTLTLRHWRPRWSIVQGAIVLRDTDTLKQSPIADVTVTASHGDVTVSTQSDATGYFKLTFPGALLPGTPIKLSFRHPNYKALDLDVPIQFRSSLRRLVIAALTPVAMNKDAGSGGALLAVSNIRVRYTVNSQIVENVGSAAKTFQVFNRGNTPCNHQAPCSPDGYWKASTGSAELDAGLGNEFREARASCIAGPCPFTQINSSGFAGGGRTITASAIDWSDTATFLVEAEVFHTAIASNVRELYPVMFGRALKFTLPPTAEGVSLESELDGVPMVFPLGPELYLSWATCVARTNSGAEKSTFYQCELKPGYRF